MEEAAAAAARGTAAEALTSPYLEAKPSRSDGTVASSTNSAAADSKHLPLSIETNSTAESRPWRENNTGGSGDPGRNNDGSDCSTVSQITQQLDKAFGSWEEVHPAALGIRSQEDEFVAGEGSGVHPASFRTGVSSKGIDHAHTLHTCSAFPREPSRFVGVMACTLLFLDASILGRDEAWFIDVTGVHKSVRFEEST